MEYKITELKVETQFVIYYGEQSKPIASASVLKHIDSTMEIKAGWVDSEWREQGLMQFLITYILNKIKEDKVDCKEIIIHTSPDNEIVNYLAKKLGFHIWHRWVYPIDK